MGKILSVFITLFLFSGLTYASCTSSRWDSAVDYYNEGQSSQSKAISKFEYYQEHFWQSVKEDKDEEASKALDAIYDALSYATRAKKQYELSKREWSQLYQSCDSGNAETAKKNVSALENKIESARRMLAGDEDQDAWMYENKIQFRFNSLLPNLADTNKTNLVKKLISMGASIERHNGPGEKPVVLALKSDQKEMFEFLVRSGAKLNDNWNPYTEEYNPTAILLAATKGENAPYYVRLLLEFGADPYQLGIEDLEGCSIVDVVSAYKDQILYADELNKVFKQHNIKAKCSNN